MTRDEAIQELNRITSESDNELAHCEADTILLEVLRSNGFEDVAEAWEEAKDRCVFWYA